MDEGLRRAEAGGDGSPEGLLQAAGALLRAGQLRAGGWLLRSHLLAEQAVPGELLDASAPSLEAFEPLSLLAYPRSDLTPGAVAWLPDGRLSVLATNARALDALNAEDGTHEPLHTRAELLEQEGAPWWAEHSWLESWTLGADPDELYLTYGEELPKGGNPQPRCHWLTRRLSGGPLRYLGDHGALELAGAAGERLLGLHGGAEVWRLLALTPGDPPIEERLEASSIRLAPGTCVTRLGTLPLPPLGPEGLVPQLSVPPAPSEPGRDQLVFRSPDGLTPQVTLPFPGVVHNSWDGLQAAWGGRAVVRDAQRRGLILLEGDQTLAHVPLPSDLPRDSWWAHYPHPSGRLAALRFEGLDAIVLLDLRDGAQRRFELPTYGGGHSLVWGPGGELAFPTRAGISVSRPR